MAGLPAARARRARGIQKAEDHALRAWRDGSFSVLRAYLASHERVHVDDLAPLLPALPADRRSLGPVFLRALREGLMVATDEFRPSAASNGGAKRVWASTIFECPRKGEEA